MVDLLHDIELGKDFPQVVNAIIEIPKGSSVKYELDKKTGAIKMDRVLHTSQYYPADYGYIPRTHWHDGDPLDVLVLSNFPLLPGTIAEIIPIAVLEMIDSGEADEKIIAVYKNDPRQDEIRELEDISPHTLKEIKHFFQTYKDLQNKIVEVKAYKDSTQAKKALEEGKRLYEKNLALEKLKNKRIS